jgi:CubicO group peptidase (beta-lactamase class C family)
MKRRDLVIGIGGAALGASLGLAGRAEAAGLSAAERAWAIAAGPAGKPLGRTDALLVLRGGRAVFERYGADSGPAIRHVSWSMAKSITHALVGVAVRQGLVDIDQPLAAAPEADRRLSLRRLITLTDGIAWDDGAYDVTKSDATRMLYGPGRLDGAAYIAAKPQAHAPGAHWNYSTGAFQLAAAEIQARLFPQARTPDARRAAMAGWMRASLFGPAGMTSAVGEFDPSGTFYGGSLVYATAADYGRFGELYCNDGVVGGARILPEGWVRFARTPTVSATYGAGFWLEAKNHRPDRALMDGKGPMDAFAAEGHAGQVILVVPSKALTIVRLGLGPDNDAAWAALGDWLTPIANSFPDA